MLNMFDLLKSLLSQNIPTQASSWAESFVTSRSSEQLVSVLSYGGYGMLAILAIISVAMIALLLSKRGLTNRLNTQLQREDQLPSAVVTTTLDGTIVKVNQRAAKMLGRLPDSLINKPIDECFLIEAAGSSWQGFEPNSRMTLKSKSSKTFVNVNVSEISHTETGTFLYVILEDCHAQQSNLNKTQTLLSDLTAKVSKQKIGIINVELNRQDKTSHVSADSIAESLLGTSFDKDASIKSIESCLSSTELSIWQRCVDSITGKEHSDSSHQSDKSIHGFFNISSEQTNDGAAGTDRLLSFSFGSHASNVIDLKQRTNNNQTTSFYILVQDAAEVKDARQQKAAASDRYQGLQNALGCGFFIMDVDGKLLEYNTQFRALTRCTGTSKAHINLYDLSCFDESFFQRLKSVKSPSTIAQSLEAKISHEIDTQRTSTDASEQSTKVLNHFVQCHFTSFVAPHPKTGEETLMILGTLHDLSEKKSLIENLEYTQNKMNMMMNFAPMGICTIDAEDRITSANKALIQRFKYNERELQHGNFYQLFADSAQAGKAAKRLQQTGELSGVTAMLKDRDGVEQPSHLFVDIIDRQKQEYLCWVADRSDANFQQQKFDSLIYNSNMPMAILTDKGFEQLNDSALEFFNAEDEYTMKNLKPYSSRLNAGELKASELKQAISQIVQTGKVLSHEWTFSIGDNQLPCHASYIPIFKDNELESILCLWMDMREVHQADEARRQAVNLKQAAEREVQEQQRLLSTSQDQLAEKIQSLKSTEEALVTVQERFAETQDEYSQLQAQHQSVHETLKKLQSDYGESRSLLETAQAKNEELKGQLDASTEQVTALKTQREQIQQSLKDSEDKYQQIRQALKAREQQVQELSQRLTSQKQKMQGLVEQMQSMQSEVSDKDAQINQVNQRIQGLQAELSSSNRNSEKLKEQLANQRKAREEAEQQRRELQETYKLAQSDIENKASHLTHLQNEMQKLSEMAQQEKGDMLAQQSALKQELEDKQAQLQSVRSELESAQASAEDVKAARDEQASIVSKLQAELQQAEANIEEKQEQMAEREKQRRQAQEKLWQELKDKQQKLQEAETVLKEAKQQTEEEKQEKEKHRQLFERLKSELKEIESRSAQQQAQISQSDQQWQRDKQALHAEMKAKRDQLEQTREMLEQSQKQADKERLERLAQEQKMQQLSVELKDVESRAEKQQEMLAGSEEQWHKYQREIEAQRQQLQQSLEHAQQQNEDLQRQLEQKLSDLKQAESKVSNSAKGEQAVLDELESSRQKAQELEAKISNQAEKEQALHKQLNEQQRALEEKEAAILALQDKQKALTDSLSKVEKEYKQSKSNLDSQQSNQNQLESQLSSLESALNDSQEQLKAKEQALEKAQSALQQSESKLTEQEQALVEAHKQELEQSNQNQVPEARVQIGKLPMPNNPNTWFDLLPYLQRQGEVESLPVALGELIDTLNARVEDTEEAIQNNDVSKIFKGTKDLIRIADQVNSEVLTDMMSSIEADCKSGMVDNVSIRWPAAKQSLQNTMRVIYSHLHA